MGVEINLDMEEIRATKYKLGAYQENLHGKHCGDPCSLGCYWLKYLRTSYVHFGMFSHFVLTPFQLNSHDETLCL